MDTPTQKPKPPANRASDKSKSGSGIPNRSTTGTENKATPTYKPTKRSLIRQYRESDAWLWTEVAAVVLGLAIVLPTGFALWSDLKDRKTQRNSQAWESVTRIAPGNSGKGPALEYLNSQGIPLVGISLSSEKNEGASYLVGVSLQEAMLETANFSEADLTSADFSRANLRKADLSGAVLTHANLSNVNLKRASLTKANLQNANLSQANLWNADLSYANFSDANLTEANLRRANLSEAYAWKANLSKANLDDANLSKATLRNMNLSGASLANTNLSQANLWHANLSGANLAGADLSGAYFENASNLTQEALDNACGNEKTKLPKGLTIKVCVNE